MKKLLLIVPAVLLAAVSYAQTGQIGVHDPVAIKAGDTYYMYSTGRGISSWKSDDKINWEYQGRVFDSIPAWCNRAVPKFKDHMWAPDIAAHQGTYYLYYSVSSFASNRSAIGVATNTTLNPADPGYKWEDHGMVVESVPGRDHFNAIDANLAFARDGTPWLSFGSFWGGIKLVKLNDDLLSVAEPEEWKTIASRERTFGLDAEDPGDGAIEAPFIIRRGEYYYLFVSFDLCCRGSRSTYNVRVGRAEDITGPYFDRDSLALTQGGGTLLVEGNEDYYAIGHNSVYRFDGAYIMYSHGYDVHDRGRSKLVIHRVLWDDEEWPYLEFIE